MITIYLLLLISVVFLSALLITSIFIFQYKKRQSYVIKFENYVVILDYHLKKAFDIIYKDRILIYSLEATKLSDKQFEATTIDFIKLVLKLIGPNLLKEFIYLYGNENTFFFNLTEYFNTRFEDDEIRKDRMTSFMESDIDDQLPKKMEMI